MNRIVWQYWESPQEGSMPPHVALCREVLRSKLGRCELRIVDPSSIHDYLPDLHPNINKVTRSDDDNRPSIAIKAGILRVLLLEKFGGFWLDTDAVMLKPVDLILDRLEEYEFVGMRRTSNKKRQVVNNFMGAHAGGKIITEYARRIRRMLAEKSSFYWNEVGSVTLTPIVSANPEGTFLYPEELIHPIFPMDQPRLLEPDTMPEEVISKNALVLMLFHRLFEGAHSRGGRGFKDYDAERMYKSQTLLGRVLRSQLSQEQFDRSGLSQMGRAF